MRLLGLDFETTGFDTANDRITEVGAVLWDTETKAPIQLYSKFVWDEELEKKCTPEVNEMMARVCGITPKMLSEFGHPAAITLDELDDLCESADYIVAHNGENYDKPLLMAELTRHDVATIYLRSLPWLDTRQDIPFAQEPDSRKLKHLALDAGFINPFAHRALFDVLTMLRVLSTYDIEQVIAYSKTPWITIRADVSYDHREKAKARRYAWEKIGEKTYSKCWVKRIKEDQLEKEKAEAGFPVLVIK